MIGIYAIKNIINDKIYIGSSKNLHKRIDDYKYNLRHNKHRNQYLQNAWNKYGEKSFEFNIIEECLEENLILKEL